MKRLSRCRSVLRDFRTNYISNCSARFTLSFNRVFKCYFKNRCLKQQRNVLYPPNLNEIFDAKK